MLFALLAAAAAQLAAPAPVPPEAFEALARDRATAFAEALESGAPLPGASPRLVLETYSRPTYRRTKSDSSELRGALAGCRRGDAWVYVYGPHSQYVALRYHCSADPQSERWPVLEQEIEGGQIAKAWVATGPRELERDRIRAYGPNVAPDESFAADRSAALAAISALQAGKTILPQARPGLHPSYRDHVASKWSESVSPASLRRFLIGCRPGTFEAEPRRWLGSRLAIVPFSCPETHKPHPVMAILLELLDGRVQSLRLEAGPPPPPIVASPAP